MIIKNSSLSFETSISSNQELTFDYISKALEENNININENNIKENLHFTANQKYTNLGLLFSDQNPFTFKLAVYQSNEKNNFLDRKEFKRSIKKEVALFWVKIIAKEKFILVQKVKCI